MISLLALLAAIASSPSDNASRLAADVRDFAVPHRSWRDPQRLDSLAGLFRGRVEASGFTCADQPFAVGGTTYRNIECTVPGLTDSVLVVGAHYDAAGPGPGADDNASGVAGLLDLAKRFASDTPKPRFTVLLVAYSLEEPPFYGTADMGSAHHARALSASGAKVVGMVSLEMIGRFGRNQPQKYPPGFPMAGRRKGGDFYAAVSDTASADLAESFRRVAERIGSLPVVRHSAPEGTAWSDHMNYWPHGWPAFMITDTGFLRNGDYHTSRDTPDKLDYKAMDGLLEIVHRWLCDPGGLKSSGTFAP